MVGGLGAGCDVDSLFVDNYLDRKGDAHFCLVPAGTSPWTNHLYESFFAGCIPVIVSDEYDVAFADELDWSRFSIRWPESEVLNPGDNDREGGVPASNGKGPSKLYRYLHELVTYRPQQLWEMKRELERHEAH